jgi:phosphoglycolate phosphatase-like HAD superfamily hydrolase
MDERKLIVWDLDDVLNEFTRDWLRLAWKAEHPECRAVYDDLHVNPPLQELGITLLQYLASIDRFRLSIEGATMTPNWPVLEWFKGNGDRFRHTILTARHGWSASVAIAWVKVNFGKWIEAIHSVGVARSENFVTEIARRKAKWLRHSGASIFVDDSQANMEAAADAGIRALLFPQPWNCRASFAQQDVLDEIARSA